MKWKFAAVLASPALLLSACGQESDAPPSPAADTASAAPKRAEVAGPERRIVALGDSLFAGYGLEPGQSYPERLEAALRAKGVNATVMNAGVSGDTSAGGLQRLAYVLDSEPQPPHLVVISLGGNDMLRGLPPAQTRSNIEQLLAELQRRKIPALLMGMLAPPNMGTEFSSEFNPIYPALAKQYQAGLVPFFLQPVVGKPELIQADRIHPTRQGIDLMVGDTLDEVQAALPKG